MNGSIRERWAGISGLVAAVFFIPFVVLSAMSSEPSDSASRAEWRSYYLDTGNQDKAQIAVMLLGAVAFFFLPFLAGLRARLRRAEGGSGWLSAAAFAGGIGFIAFLLVTAAASAAVVTAANYFDHYRVNVDIGQTLSAVTYMTITYAGVAGGVLVGAASLVALKTLTLPKWLAIAGFVVAFAGFVSVMTFGVSVALEAAWLLVVSAIMATGRPAPQPVKEPALGAA
jgi:hypothetical protein